MVLSVPRNHIAALREALVVLMLVGVSAPSPGYASWPPNGLAFCQGDTCQRMNNCVIDADGTGGAVLVWERNNQGLAAQRITRDGLRAPGWQPNGTTVTRVPGRQEQRASCPDGVGGTFVVWTDVSPDQNIYATHLTATGGLAPGWPVNGLVICGASSTQYTWLESCMSDGEGGFYTVWEDLRTEAQTSWDVYCHRIRADGSPHPGWAVNGQPVCTATLEQSVPVFALDGQGGVFITWGDYRLGAWLQHLLPDGSRAPGFPVDGKLVLPAGTLGFVTNSGALIPDGAGGVFMMVAHRAPEDPSSSDRYVLRIQADGTIAPGWLVNGLPRPTGAGLTGDQFLPFPVADGAGGVFVAWEDQRNYQTSASDIYIIRYLADGSLAPGFAATGNVVFGGPAFQLQHVMNGDGAGGVYLACQDLGSNPLQTQHLKGNGQPAPGWPSGGRPISTWAVAHRPRGMCGDDAGGAYVLWESGGSAVFTATGFIQRLVTDGIVSTLASVLSHEASAERVRLVWAGPSLDGPFAVQRRMGDGSQWITLGDASWAPDDRLTYEDTTVEPGASYVYRLSYAAAGTPTTSGEVAVQIPSIAAFALMGAVPNPALASDLRVRFSVPDAGPVTLTLVDLNGRRVHEQTEQARTIGVHDVRLAANAAMRPGLYWLVMEHGAKRASSRVTIVR